MTDKRSYTIGELAQQAGVTPRTVRYYTTEGLLPQPDTRGRYARYSHAHLARLAEIVRLKAQYLPLHVIRERLTKDAGSSSEIQPSVSAAPPLRLSKTGPSARNAPPHIAGARHDAEPLRAGTEASVHAGTPGDSVPPLQLGHYQFFPDLPEPLAAQTGEGAEPERWQRISLAPGVELHVREPLSPERRRRLEALIAAARDQLGDEPASP